ncbi:MAG: hypothetical protein JWN54_1348, partial [Mycobacterium sp.]|nr:hypothetical protein [Mycobacterium sp.]
LTRRRCRRCPGRVRPGIPAGLGAAARRPPRGRRHSSRSTRPGAAAGVPVGASSAAASGGWSRVPARHASGGQPSSARRSPIGGTAPPATGWPRSPSTPTETPTETPTDWPPGPPTRRPPAAAGPAGRAAPAAVPRSRRGHRSTSADRPRPWPARSTGSGGTGSAEPHRDGRAAVAGVAAAARPALAIDSRSTPSRPRTRRRERNASPRGGAPRGFAETGGEPAIPPDRRRPRHPRATPARAG